MIHTSFLTIPEKNDSERFLLHPIPSLLMNGMIKQKQNQKRPKQYVVKNPTTTPSYYPQVPLSTFENPAIFEKFDTDTLFFIFYYQQGTYEQYFSPLPLFSS